MCGLGRDPWAAVAFRLIVDIECAGETTNYREIAVLEVQSGALAHDQVTRNDTRSRGSVVIREDEFVALELLAEMRACA